MELPSLLTAVVRVLAKFAVGFALLYVIVFLLVAALLSLARAVSPLSQSFARRREEELRGEHVVVTGGSSGIGLEVARLYLSLGARVTIVARSAHKLEEARQSLLTHCKNSDSSANDAEQRLQTVSCDVSAGEEAVRVALSPALALFGDCHTLINCAGISIAGAFDALDAGEFERMLRVNVLGSVAPTRVVLPAMKRARRGQIVFVSSQVAQAAIHGYSAYAASKWALRGLAEALQMEVKPYNISVSLSYPPDTDTPGYKEEMQSKPSLTREISETGVVVPAQEVARDIVFYARRGYYGISTGLDGWLLKQLHPGMSPCNDAWEVTQQVMFASLMRLVSVFYVLYWDWMVANAVHREEKEKSNTEKKKNQ